jgi:hypothetical protein
MRQSLIIAVFLTTCLLTAADALDGGQPLRIHVSPTVRARQRW